MVLLTLYLIAALTGYLATKFLMRNGEDFMLSGGWLLLCHIGSMAAWAVFVAVAVTIFQAWQTELVPAWSIGLLGHGIGQLVINQIVCRWTHRREERAYLNHYAVPSR